MAEKEFKLSNRGEEWASFSQEIANHVENYCVPQYGDFPDDQMTRASIDNIKHNMSRYVERMGRNSRGREEALRDMKKMAHYACIAYNKLVAQYEAEDAENAEVR